MRYVNTETSLSGTLKEQLNATVCVLLALLLSVFQGAFGQSISVTPANSNADVENYVQNVLLGSCVTATNVQFIGYTDTLGGSAAGTFNGSGTSLGLSGGVLLSSGAAQFAVGPDNANSAGQGNLLGGDPDLNALASPFTTYDAAVLEFDFVPQSDTLRFNYIFGSEEYPEYVNAGYNDVFGFFISGPGISGPFSGGAVNIALIPGTATPVAIDNVNNGYSAYEPSTGPCNNCAYYTDNSSGPAVQYDGHTTVLTAQVVVTPCQTYHIKLAIADAGDGALDSGVFLEEGSFSANGDDAVELAAISGVSGIYEGCDIGTFVFRRLPGSNNSSPLTVGYNVSGTATPGADYNALPGSITIPAGQDSVVLNIQGVLDYTTEGTETVILDLVGGGCTCTAPPSVSMDILDNDTPLALTTSGTTTICLGESVNLTANTSGSVTPYTSGWDNGAPAGNNVTVSPTTTTTYTFTLTDACGGQTLNSSETVTVVRPDFTVDDDEQCFDGHSFSFTNTGATGGSVTHHWDFGDSNSSSLENPTYVYASSGNYTVTHYVIYVAEGCTASADASIAVFDEPSVLAIVDQNVSCAGGSDGGLTAFVSGGTSPFNYLWTPGNQTTQSITGLSVGSYTVNVTDANGCTDAVTGNIIQDDSELPNALCQNATVYINSMGSATISATAVDAGSSDNCGIASLVVSPNAFTCADVGANPVVLTVTDVNGNVASCNATVNVLDTVAPTALCQNLTVTLDASGNASITSAQIDNGSFDNCGVQSISLNPNTFTCSDLGANTVTLTVTDVGGNVSTCGATVTVLEDTDPNAVCQDISVSLDATGNVSVTGTQLGSGSTDNCAIVDITVTPSDFTCAEIGDNPVVVTVVDANGNSASCNATVSVSDDLAPNAVCQNISVYLDGSGNASIVAADVDGGSTDNCAIDNISATPTDFTCADVGPNAVQLTVTDVSGNQSNCVATVSVEDTISPVAVCQDVTVQLDQNGNASVVASDVDNGSTDNCGSVTLDITPNSFDCTVSSPGQVQLSVTDASGNVSTCTAIVNLVENTPPTAVCQDVSVQLDAAGNASVVAADVDGGSFDNCGVATLSVNPSTFDCSNVGENTVTLTASDANGNSATCSAIITVIDNVNPTAICQDITVQLDATGSVSIAAADVDNGSTDNCGITSYSVTPNAFNCSNLGMSSVTLTVTDANGNTSTCSANVTVEDNVPPTALCQDITVQLDANGNVSVVPGQVDNGSADVCGLAGLSLDITDFDCSNLGQNAVVLTVEDNSGNTSTCSANVVVEDGTNPNAVCQNMTLYLDANGVAGVSPSDVDGGSTDNCSVDGFSLSQTDFTCADLGQGFVTLTVTDGSGNTDDCVSVFNVLDTISPAISNCPSDITVQPGSSNCTPSVIWTAPTESDNCSVTMSSNFSSGDNFPVGTTTVVYTATDQSGNSATCTFTITVEPSDVIVSVSSPTFACGYNISCNGANDGSATASVSGGCEAYQFSWSNGQTTQTAVDLFAGQHIVTVTDANGTQVSDTIVLTEPTPLAVDSISSFTYVGGNNVSCAGASDGSINLDVSGGSNCDVYDFSWTGPNGFASGMKDINGLSAGSYSVTVTDVNGCSISTGIVLTEPDSMQLESFPTTYNGYNISCFGLSDGFINLEVSDGTAPYSYQWGNAEQTQDIDSLTAGSYSVIVTDTNGCVAQHTVVLSEPTDLVIVPTDTILVNCFGGSDGQFTVQASGSVPTYSYEWSNGDVDPILNGVGVGVYQVVVTDNNGCQDSLSLEMTSPDSIEVDVLSVSDATCFGYDDGSATIEATGGIGPYQYNWPAIAQSGQTATDLTAGFYIYEVTDANGCVSSDTVQVSSPEMVTLVTSNDTIICPNTPITLFAEASGGGGTYLITWENGQGFGTSFETYISQTTNVAVSAVDQNGCASDPNSVIVSTFNNLTAAFDFNVVDNCVSPATVEFTNTSVNANAYSWVFGNADSSTQFMPSATYLTPGVYNVSLLATSADGCLDSVTVPVTIHELPVAAFEIPYPDGCFPIVVGLYNQSSNANTYLWDFGDGETSDEANPYHFFEDAGAYTVSLIATNQFGCSDTLTVDTAVFAYPRPVAGFNIIPTGNDGGDEFFFTNSSTGGNEYLWTFDDGQSSELFEPVHEYDEFGDYTIVLRVYNEYGCVDTAQVFVHVDLISGLFVPNAMAIGEPGEAGLFLPKGEGIGQYHAWVYDLWGNLLWESTELTSNGNPAEGWDARYKGKLVPQGSYTWKVEATFKNGEVWEGMEQPFGKPKTVGSVTVLY